MSTESVKTNIFGHVLEVTLDRPKANAIDLKTSKIMGDVFCDFRDNPNLRVAIITGSGEKFFCAGWDLKAAADGDAVDGDYGVGGFGGLQELPHMNKPVIAYIAGLTAPKGRVMGHAGAIVSAYGESAVEKVEILKEFGITISKNPSVMGETVKSVLEKI